MSVVSAESFQNRLILVDCGEFDQSIIACQNEMRQSPRKDFLRILYLTVKSRMFPGQHPSEIWDRHSVRKVISSYKWFNLALVRIENECTVDAL